MNLEEALAEAAALVILLVDMVMEGHRHRRRRWWLWKQRVFYKEEQAGQVAVEDIMVGN